MNINKLNSTSDVFYLLLLEYIYFFCSVWCVGEMNKKQLSNQIGFSPFEVIFFLFSLYMQRGRGEENEIPNLHEFHCTTLHTHC